MLPLEFFGQNSHFVISLFAALVFFAVFWLYFDAWLANRHEVKTILKWVGFLLLCLSFVAYATVVARSALQPYSFLGNLSGAISEILRVLGYASIVISELMDPLQKKPRLAGLNSHLFEEQPGSSSEPAKPTPSKQAEKRPSSSRKRRRSAQALGLSGVAHGLNVLSPIGALGVGVLYWRRATTGLERHLKPIGVAFMLLFGFEALSLLSLQSDSSNPSVAKFLAPFGPVWDAEHIFLLAASLVLGWWVWQYLTKRFVSQLFMLFTSVTLGIFLVITICFTYLLVNSVQSSALNNLNTAASVLNYAFNSKKAQTLANSEAIAESPAIAAAVAANDHNQLVSLTKNFLSNKGESSLIITNDNAEVLLRAENPDSYGDSISSDTLVRRALIGEESSSISTQSGVLAPLIYIRSATPIENAQQQVVGTAIVALVLDNAFIDGIKHSTGLDSSIYANNIVSATTFLAPDGVSRWAGVKQTDPAINRLVLGKGQNFKGLVSVLNRQYLGVYLPLRDIDNSVIGMLFIGQSSLSVFQAADRSIELTFIVTAILLICSIVPAYLMARYISRQLE